MEIDPQTLQGHWNEVRDRIKEHWTKLGDDDIKFLNGNVDQLVGRIQQKTGESRESIERFLSEATEQLGSTIGTVRSALGNASERAEQAVQHGYETLKGGYSEAKRMVHNRPAQAIGITFALGVVAGLGLSFLIRQRSPYHEGLSQRIMESLAHLLPESLASHCRN